MNPYLIGIIVFMEAWILHFKKEWATSPSFQCSSDEYAAWCTERQALAHASKILMANGFTIFGDCNALHNAVSSLIAKDSLKEAIELVNEQSRVIEPQGQFGRSSQKITIKITKSTFKGSPFE